MVWSFELFSDPHKIAVWLLISPYIVLFLHQSTKHCSFVLRNSEFLALNDLGLPPSQSLLIVNDVAPRSASRTLPADPF